MVLSHTIIAPCKSGAVCGNSLSETPREGAVNLWCSHFGLLGGSSNHVTLIQIQVILIFVYVLGNNVSWVPSLLSSPPPLCMLQFLETKACLREAVKNLNGKNPLSSLWQPPYVATTFSGGVQGDTRCFTSLKPTKVASVQVLQNFKKSLKIASLRMCPHVTRSSKMNVALAIKHSSWSKNHWVQ